MGLVDGIVTEDSDAFLFGAKNVYKYFFSSEHSAVHQYSIENIQHQLGLNRCGDQMIRDVIMIGNNDETKQSNNFTDGA